MDISQQGLAVLEEREGCILHAYPDVKGIWTIGVGHTAAAGSPIPVPGLSISQAEADGIFHKDLSPCIDALNACGEMSQCEFDAGVSLIFNIGVPAFRGSTFRRMLLAKNWNAAGRSILMWNEPPQIRSRREGEYVQYMHGEYVARIEA
jgi:lysozyme